MFLVQRLLVDGLSICAIVDIRLSYKPTLVETYLVDSRLQFMVGTANCKDRGINVQPTTWMSS
ncbi:hypothetical protein HNP41_004982 [Pseudomonas aeruginosa]|nr:hypothetical protein L683_24970 [Pseudomonas aeruginosa WC55]ERV80091.1 hypothetical protein Q041_05107 [Pseudomonas aeruginosa BWHPSA028]ETU80160.1 hypothetical protein Q095_00613 [Pseudomonas aeruginosa PS50]KJS74232.1 MAG: hypothetical protein JL55_23660 [[Pseudomonas] sp. BICA1-14]MBB4851210.1 hypothetical protein [Pseudomonas aeruginosa]